MLHYVKGTLTIKFNGGIVVEAGGLGYEIFVPGNSDLFLTKEGEDVFVYTTMIVREDDMSLYGFGDKDSLEAFQLLITVSGVGAKAAISILSAIPMTELKQAIVFEDADTLTRANGIGKKTAQRIVLELKDKFDRVQASITKGITTDIGHMEPDTKGEAMSALLALGYSKAEASNALTAVNEEDLTTEEYVKLALRKLF